MNNCNGLLLLNMRGVDCGGGRMWCEMDEREYRVL